MIIKFLVPKTASINDVRYKKKSQIFPTRVFIKKGKSFTISDVRILNFQLNQKFQSRNSFNEYF